MRDRPSTPNGRGRRPASGTILAIILIIAIIIVGGLSAWSRLGQDDDEPGAAIEYPIVLSSQHVG